MVRLTDTHWGIGSVLMRSVQRHLVWFWLLAVIACGEEHVKMGGSSLTQFEPLDQEISKIPSVPLTEFAFHGEDLLRLELELNKGLFAPGYREARFDQAGNPIEHPPEAWANAVPCHYHGWTVDTGTDLVVGLIALSTCHREDGAWTGLMLVDTQQFRVHGQTWSLTVMPVEPIELGDDGLTILDEPFVASIPRLSMFLKQLAQQVLALLRMTQSAEFPRRMQVRRFILNSGSRMIGADSVRLGTKPSRRVQRLLMPLPCSMRMAQTMMRIRLILNRIWKLFS